MSTQTDTVRYELMVIVSPEIGEAAIKNRLGAIRKSVTDFGGEILFEDAWGLRDLAYSIRKQDQGYYSVLDMNLDPKQVKDLERMLRLEVEVLRHLLIKLPAVYQPKTLAAMDAENAIEAKKQAEINEEKKAKTGGRGVVRKPDAAPQPVKELPKEIPVEKAATPKEAPKVAKKVEAGEETPKKTAMKKEESKQSLEDIDKKLDSILSNPDINF